MDFGDRPLGAEAEASSRLLPTLDALLRPTVEVAGVASFASWAKHQAGDP